MRLLAATTLIAWLLPSAALGQRPLVPTALEPPRGYVAYRAAAPPRIDGRLDERSWAGAPWTDDFVDIRGAAAPPPRLRTRAKLLWDGKYLYVGAELREPDVWATIARRDAVIFQENDFELFIDPDGDTHDYYEIELNALGTVWDLLLTAPYRDGGRAIDAWDVRGLKVGVHVDGTLNRPGDRDRGWTVELALPWDVLWQAAAERRPPHAGERWRVNFSRVEWDVAARGGTYVKRTDASGRPLPEHNWVWSPQGAVNMHMPERWGYVQFSMRPAGTRSEPFVRDPDEGVAEALRALYYAQRTYRESHGRYAADLAQLAPAAPPPGATMQATADLYEIVAPAAGGRTLHIRQDGLAWATRQ